MNRKAHWMGWLCAGYAAVCLPLMAAADTLRVPLDYPTVQAAIDAAADGDEIIVAAGTYSEAIDFHGKAIYLHSADGPATTIIDATGLYASVVTCATGEGPQTVLEGFTITGGFTFYGAGMVNYGSSPTVTNCAFTGNTGVFSGGMSNSGGSPTVTNCAFTGNTVEGTPLAPGIGGGMSNNGGSPIVTNCVFTGNTARDYGGGMCNGNSNPTVTDCTFSGNSADYGGGMFNEGS